MGDKELTWADIYKGLDPGDVFVFRKGNSASDDEWFLKTTVDGMKLDFPYQPTCVDMRDIADDGAE